MQRHNFLTTPTVPSASLVTSDGAKYRFSILTDGIVRYEWATDGQFEDRASTFAVNRHLPTPEFRVLDYGERGLEIITKRFHLTYDKTAFSTSGLTAQVLGDITSWKSHWRFAEPAETLGGTARTLDEAKGCIPLGDGILSRYGYASIDDSKSMLFDGDGWVASRKSGERVDGYLFAYGHDYRTAMHDFYSLTGHPPLLPRWALGNWWCRYHAYSAEEYLALMDRFSDEHIPFSVAVLDMDWHLVKDKRVQETGASGWTGYTWNDKLFPDPEKFLAEIHRRNLKVTLNDHPADGVWSYEVSYEDMAKALNHDTSNKDPILFEATDCEFLDAYFNILRRRIEKQGVDFWWLDWQQGTASRVPGLDPLWILNHFSYLDNSGGDNRPLNLSRFSGPGSHRYPIGFSGDTWVSWASLDFQPEFTNTASNIGYGWWSHDVGGHQMGSKDDELTTRWVQLGVFSPIFRLHSTANMWMGKEPWNYDPEYQKVMTDFMRFRHRMIPYLYTMNVRASQGEPLCQPMYWECPEQREAYSVPNQYYFGSQLIVVPVTSPRNSKTRLATCLGWLPPGNFTDIFTETTYSGNRYVWFNRSLNQYPVLAREGAIIPLDANATPKFGCANINSFELMIAVGADGSFELIEDNDANEDNLKSRRTGITFSQANGTVHVRPTEELDDLPNSRSWKFRFLSCVKPVVVRCLINDELDYIVSPCTASYGFSIEVRNIAATSSITLTIGANPQRSKRDARIRLTDIISDAQIDFSLKERIWAALDPELDQIGKIMRISALPMEKEMADALLEVLLTETIPPNK